MIVGTLSKDDNHGSENVGKKMNLRSFEFNRSIWTRAICQMQATFPGVEFLRDFIQVQREEENSSWHVHALHKTAN